MNEIEVANKTARSSGAVGVKAIVPKQVRQVAFDKSMTILDFGSGPEAIHTKALREEGFNVTAHEFGANVREIHDPKALERTYDIVFASNVLNVQSSKSMLIQTLRDIKGCMHEHSIFICNYPKSLRKGDFSNEEIKSCLRSFFGRVGDGKGNLYCCGITSLEEYEV